MPEIITTRQTVWVLPERYAGMTWALADGILYPLTDCCQASGKGGMGHTGVVCRACYQPVSSTYGLCYLVRVDPGMESWAAPAELLAQVPADMGGAR